MIEMVGGINEKTGVQCVMAGADILVAGSTIFGTKNIKEMCQKLIKL